MRFLQSKIGKIFIWAVLSLFISAFLSPWVCIYGRALGFYVMDQEYAPWVEKLARSFSHGKFNRYFNRTWMATALCLLPFLIAALRRNHHDDNAFNPRLNHWKIKPRTYDYWRGLCVGLVSFSCLALIVIFFFDYTEKPNPVKSIRYLIVLFQAHVVAFLEEWFFRGVILAFWLRCAKPPMALIGSAALFSLVHFIQPNHMFFSQQSITWLTGLQLLKGSVIQFIDPQFLVGKFLTLFGAGFILGFTYYRTQRLWFPIGLHAGWVFIHKVFFLRFTEGAVLQKSIWLGGTLLVGLAPLACMILTGVVCWCLKSNPRQSGSQAG